MSLEEKLLRTISLVVSGKVEAKDELLLDKLLSHLQKDSIHFCKKKSKVFEDGTVCRIARDLISDSLDASAKAFGMRFMGLILKDMNEFFAISVVEPLNALVKHWIELSVLPSEALVCAAGIDMLSALTANDFLMENIITRELINTVVNCMQSKNVYVSSGAQTFLACVISKTIGDENRKKFPIVNAISTDLTVYLMQKLQRRKHNSDYWKQTVVFILPVLKKICERNEFFAQDFDLALLLHLLPCQDRCISGMVCEVLALTVASRIPIEPCLDQVFKTLGNDIISRQQFAILILSKSADLSDRIIYHLETQLFPEMRPEELPPKELSIVVETLKQSCHCLKNRTLQSEVFHHLGIILSENLEDCAMSIPRKLHISLLSCIQVLLAKWKMTKDDCFGMLGHLLVSLTDPKIPTLVLVKSMKTTQNLLELCCQPNENDTLKQKNMLTHVLSVVSELISKFLSHPEWEIRDSAVELISQLAKAAKDETAVKEIVTANNIPILLWEQLLYEDESFVRASIIPALLNFSTVPIFWGCLTNKHPQAEIVHQVIKIATDDPEAIVRRAGCQLLSEWFTNVNFSDFRRSIQSFMQKAITDLDWEVKLAALEFWKQILAEVENKHDVILTDSESDELDEKSETERQSILKDLNKAGWCSSLLAAAEDCDVCVRLEAVVVLRTVKKAFVTCNFSPVVLDASENKPSITEETLPSVVPFDLQAAEDVLAEKDEVTVEKLMQSRSSVMTVAEDPDDSLVLVEPSVFVQRLKDADLEVLEEELKKSTDLHENNLENLLDDLLPSGVEKDNNVLDCY